MEKYWKYRRKSTALYLTIPVFDAKVTLISERSAGSMLHRISILALLSFAVVSARGGTIVIDFETFPDSTPITDSTSITTQFPGLIFTDTTVITAGIGLNELELPPHSGTNVAFDDGGPISIVFSSPISSFSGYFTYFEPLTLAAFDASDDQVATATSLFSSNDALFGDPGSSPNEFLKISSAAGISSVTITGDPGGSSFVLDDISYAPQIPEPSGLALILVGFATTVVIRRQNHFSVLNRLSKCRSRKR